MGTTGVGARVGVGVGMREGTGVGGAGVGGSVTPFGHTSSARVTASMFAQAMRAPALVTLPDDCMGSWTTMDRPTTELSPCSGSVVAMRNIRSAPDAGISSSPNLPLTSPMKHASSNLRPSEAYHLTRRVAEQEYPVFSCSSGSQ